MTVETEALRSLEQAIEAYETAKRALPEQIVPAQLAVRWSGPTATWDQGAVPELCEVIAERWWDIRDDVLMRLATRAAEARIRLRKIESAPIVSAEKASGEPT